VEVAGQNAAEGPQLLVTLVLVLVGQHLERVAVGVGIQASVNRLERPRVGRREPQQRSRPELGLVGAPELIPRGLVDGVVLARPVLQDKAAGEALQVERIGGHGGMRLPVLFLGFGAGNVLDLRQRQQVAVLGGVQDVWRGDDQPRAGPQRGKFDGADMVAVDAYADCPVLEQQGEPAGGAVGGEHPLQYRERHPRLVADLANPPGSWVQRPPAPGGGGERVPGPVVVADPFTKLPVQGGAAELFDPGMLVGRYRLGGQLAAHPIGLLGEDDLAAQLAGAERGRNPAKAAADDEDLGAELRRDGPGRLRSRRSRPHGRVGRWLLGSLARRSGGRPSRRRGSWGWPARLALDGRAGQEPLALLITHGVALEELDEEADRLAAHSAAGDGEAREDLCVGLGVDLFAGQGERKVLGASQPRSGRGCLERP
jgi:hypothetical protein